MAAISHSWCFSGNSSVDGVREDIQDPSEIKYLITEFQHCQEMEGKPRYPPAFVICSYAVVV